jgi:hypothetical protein
MASRNVKSVLDRDAVHLKKSGLSLCTNMSNINIYSGNTSTYRVRRDLVEEWFFPRRSDVVLDRKCSSLSPTSVDISSTLLSLLVSR